MTLPSFPAKHDILIVAEDWVFDLLLEDIFKDLNQDTGDASDRTVWHVCLREGSASCLLDACVPPPSLLRRVGEHLDSSGGRAAHPTQRSRRVPRARVVRLEHASLAIWPMFGEIFVQKDVRLDEAARTLLRDALSERSSDDGFEWLCENLSKEEAESREKADCVKQWLKPSVLPLGLLCAHLARHELSVPESTVIRVVSLSAGHPSYDDELEGQLDANKRIFRFRFDEVFKEDFTAWLPQNIHCTGKDIAKPAAHSVVRIMRALLCRKISSSMGFRPSSVSADCCSSKAQPVVPTWAIFIDDNLANVRSLSNAFGVRDETGSFSRSKGSAPHVVACRTGNGQPKRLGWTLEGDTSEWDEQIRNKLRSTQGDVASHLFVVCDYDLNCSWSSTGKVEGDRERDSALTGAKLAALVRNHWLTQQQGPSSRADLLVSALVFSGGRSPIIALETISDGCDLAIAKSFNSDPHPPADVDGMAALMFWIWVISSHHSLINGQITTVHKQPEAAIQQFECVSRCVIRRGVVLPTSLQPHLNRLRFEVYRSLQEADPWSEVQA